LGVSLKEMFDILMDHALIPIKQDNNTMTLVPARQFFEDKIREKTLTK